MKQSFPQILWDQLVPAPPVETTSLEGRTVMVVGANRGIGIEAVKHFARLNADRIIMACRSEDRAKAAMAGKKNMFIFHSLRADQSNSEVEKETGYTKCEISLLDLTKFSSVVEFAERFDKDGGRLDLLIMNAGINTPYYKATPDDWEST